MSASDGIFIALFIVCTGLSAYFAAAEVAIVSLQRYKLQGMLKNGVKSARQVQIFKDNPERFFSTILLGNNLVNVAAASLGTAIFVGLLGEERGILVSTIVATTVLLVLGDAIPKTSAAHHAETISVKLAPSVRILSWLLSPFVLALSWITSSFGRILGARPMGRSLVSEEEIRALITMGHEEGTVEESEAQMLHKVFEFGDRPAREIMVPRTEVIFIEKGSKILDYFQLYIEHPLNRYPVFEEKRDNVVGILSSKDILLSLARGTCDIERTIDDLIRPAFFAYEGKHINEILAEMREKNYHMCIVVDEYGGVAGVLTLTQLVEEIVGDVKDELGTAEKDFEIINDTTFEIDGSMRIEDVNTEMKLHLPKGDYDTMAGFVLKLMGHIPRTGEQVRYKDLKIEVTRMLGMKIEEVLVTKEKRAETADKVQPRA